MNRKRILVVSFFVALLSTLPIKTYAADFIVDGLRYYVLSVTEKTVALVENDYQGEIVIPSEVAYNGTTFQVSEIRGAFWESSVTKVTIPNSITYMSKYSFQNCLSLTELIIEDGTNYLTIETDHLDSSYPYCYFKNCPLETIYYGRSIRETFTSGSINGIWLFDSSVISQITIGPLVTKLFSKKPYAWNYVTFNHQHTDCDLVVPHNVTEISCYLAGFHDIVIEDNDSPLLLSHGIRCYDNMYVGRSVEGEMEADHFVFGESVKFIGDISYHSTNSSIVFSSKYLSFKSVRPWDSGTHIGTIYCKSKIPPSTTIVNDPIQAFTTEDYMFTKLYVPIGCKSIYAETEPWCYFLQLEEGDFYPPEDPIVTLQAQLQNEGSVNLNWNVMAPAPNYIIYRNGGVIATLTNTTTYQDNITTGGNYCYQIEAVYTPNASFLSNEECVESHFSLDETSEKLEIYPNPLTKERVLSINTTDDFDFITITDMNGRQVYASYYEQSIFALPTSIRSGIYVLSLEKDNKTICRKRLIVN